MTGVAAVGGILLTGGASRRLGVDKASLVLDGETLAARAARVLLAVCEPVVEVGRGVSELPAVCEEPPGSGPLAALVTGATSLRARGHHGAAVLLAVDLPRLTVDTLARLVRAPGTGTVVPVVDGYPQTTCARYGPDALAHASVLVAAGERSLRALLDATGFRAVDLVDLGLDADARPFDDVDTPADAGRFGLWPRELPEPGLHDPV